MEKLEIKVGKNHTLSQLQYQLVDFGYERTTQEPVSGEYRLLGGLLKIMPVDGDHAYSVDFFGDEIEKIYDSDKTLYQKINLSPNILQLKDNTKILPGSFVVHEDHGIGMFEKIGQRIVGGETIDYIFVRYRNDDLLYVPFTQLEKLSSYIGVGRRKPKLSRLGSSSWARASAKVYEDVIKVARELLEIYAKRELKKKEPRKIYSDWNENIVESFQFKETDDQQLAINDVLVDLSNVKPMDRLVCGDVGFGKTEVAIRAAAQTIANGYQVAILVPTTILAEQHFETFRNRFSGLPVKVARISRFLPKDIQNETIKDASCGKLDLLIGTHKIIHSNIQFQNLGLLIIDEEQKFGVKDKERLKIFRENIDVLTLTATPIPRTLFMSLSGIRDISQISSIPAGRKAVETKVELFSEENTISYIKREIGRGGQVYYLHNEVNTIIGRANWLKREFPDLEIAIAHGQMSEDRLSETMRRFAASEIKVLVCSTIIENGLDLPNVNTLIVEEADKFGLSQLYQIRGRIGRSKRQSYALFTYREKKLTDNATKRLKALLDNNELGAGYNIALSDLEIRGGGNILGREQHGNMEAMGLVLYSKMLKLAVEKIRHQGNV